VKATPALVLLISLLTSLNARLKGVDCWEAMLCSSLIRLLALLVIEFVYWLSALVQRAWFCACKACCSCGVTGLPLDGVATSSEDELPGAEELSGTGEDGLTFKGMEPPELFAEVVLAGVA